MDIAPDAAAAGIDLSVPVGEETGAFDIKVDWTWKDPVRREEGRVGQYYVDEAPKKQGDGAQNLPKLDLWELYKTVGLPVTIVLGLFGLIGYGITWLLGKNLGPWRKFLNQVWEGFPKWFKWLLKQLPF